MSPSIADWLNRPGLPASRVWTSGSCAECSPHPHRQSPPDRETRPPIRDDVSSLFLISEPGGLELEQGGPGEEQALSNPAIRTWNSMLPEPGSRYAQKHGETSGP